MPTASKTTYAEAFKAVLSLSKSDQRKLISQFKRSHGSTPIDIETLNSQLRERRFRKGLACPHCESDKIVRNGHQNGQQKYKCNACRKNYSDRTHTPMRGVHDPEKWFVFIEHLLLGYSLRRSAKILHKAVSTLWTWRHKILEALKRLEGPVLEGIGETDETYIRANEKGNRHIKGRSPRKRGTPASKRGLSFEQVCVLVVRDRNGSTLCQVAGQGNLSKVKAGKVLDGKLDNVTTLCSDASLTWKAYTKDSGIKHVVLNQSKKTRVKGIHHIQNVNACHSRLKDWIRDFRGVASKYLDNYLVLFRFVDAHRGESIHFKTIKLIIDACLPVSPERYHEIRTTEFILPT